MRRLIALVWLVGWLSIAAGARADMQLGMESDEALKHDTAAYLARTDGVGATWMRLTVGSGRWLTESDTYVNAAAAAQADGKRVLVTLMSWQQYPTPEAWAAFAQQVVARMAPYVDAWSPLNEPNHWAMAPVQTVTLPARRRAPGRPPARSATTSASSGAGTTRSPGAGSASSRRRTGSGRT